jgi:hypothetical protein
MRLILTLQDSKGNKLNFGDIVRVDTGRLCTTFFAEVKYLEKEKAITPFHTFSFHKFFKVDSVPAEAVKSTEERYNIWYLPTGNDEYDNASQYLIDWRQCEHLLENGCYYIEVEK